MNKIEEFKKEIEGNQKRMRLDKEFKSENSKWIEKSFRHKYTYNFTWLGRPIIQFPQDIIAMQEIIWDVKPDLIIEIGVAHGGSLIFHASMLELIGNSGKVLGVDIDIREHNRKEIENHPMFRNIDLIEGSSTSKEIANKIYKYCKEYSKILLILDSNHTYSHVLEELNLYSNLVAQGSYVIVQDTIISDLPDEFFSDRPWNNRENNPKTAVKEFLKNNNNFIIDESIESKLLITNCPSGYLKRIR